MTLHKPQLIVTQPERIRGWPEYVMFAMLVLTVNALIFISCAGYGERQLGAFLALVLAELLGAVLLLFFQLGRTS